MLSQVFISYSHKDKKYLERLQVFLKPLEREGYLRRWDDTKIDPGGKWKKEIKKAIDSSFAAILLISADFLASDFITTNELPPLLEASEERGLLILPVIVSPCGFKRTKILSKFQAVNPGLKPLVDMRKGEREALWDKVAEAIQNAVPPSEGVAANDKPSIPSPFVKSYPYDSGLYEYDKNNCNSEATLLDGAYLYRLTSLSHSRPGDILSGKGSVFSREIGRFNHPQQRTTYCANNILICLSEALYNMYRQTLNALVQRMSYYDVFRYMKSIRSLVIFRINEINDLVYAGAVNVKNDYKFDFISSMLVHPDHHISHLLNLSDKIRLSGKRGIIYPSPRHPVDMAIALFHDESSRLRNDFYEVIPVELKLLPEDHDPAELPIPFDPFKKWISSCMGYYRFVDSKKLEKAKKLGSLNPNEIPNHGIIYFVRKRYVKYPKDAIKIPSTK